MTKRQKEVLEMIRSGKLRSCERERTEGERSSR